MSNFHSAYRTDQDEYLEDYANRSDGRKLVRELIEDLVRGRLGSFNNLDEAIEFIPTWCAEHPIALLENEFHVEIRQHDQTIDFTGSSNGRNHE